DRNVTGVQTCALPIYTNGKQVIIDEPKKLGGTDQGPNPVEYVLSALGGCVNVLVVSFAKSFGVQVEDLQVHVEGDLDSDGFLGKIGRASCRERVYVSV